MNRILSLFVLFAFFAVAVNSFAATPTVTVTLADFTADHSGAGYVVRITPVTGGIARRELTDADGLASFSAVTPAIYSLSIENAGVPTLQIRVPDTADTTAASTIVISAWTPPSTGTIQSGIWENDAGTIKPSANGQNRNTLQFTSSAADDADSIGLLVDTAEPWRSGSLLTLNSSGTNHFTFLPGSLLSTISYGAETEEFQVFGSENDGSYAYLTSAGVGVPRAVAFSAAVDYTVFTLSINSEDKTILYPDVPSGTAIAYTFNTSNQLTNGDNIVSFQNTNAVRFAVDHAGAVTAADAVTAGGLVTGTGFVSASGYAAVGTTNRWKTGAVVTGATVALTLTNYVSITINGVAYKLGLVQ